nr:hypothetical protein [Burkholderia sp. THE68]
MLAGRSAGAHFAIQFGALDRFFSTLRLIDQLLQADVATRIDPEGDTRLFRGSPHCFDFRCQKRGCILTVFDVDADNAGVQNWFYIRRDFSGLSE